LTILQASKKIRGTDAAIDLGCAVRSPARIFVNTFIFSLARLAAADII
jgi:hypothetical protein